MPNEPTVPELRHDKVNGEIAKRTTVFLRIGLHERLKVLAIKKGINFKDLVDGVLNQFADRSESKDVK